MLALLLGGVASGSPATDYIDAQVAVDLQLQSLYVNYTVGAVLAGTESAPVLAAAQEQIHGLLVVAQGQESWPGGDQGLNAAVIQRAEHSVLFFDQTLPTMVSLAGSAYPRDADQLQFETLTHLSKVTDAQDVERMSAALVAFGDANRVQILDRVPEPLGAPTLELGLPGYPSALPSTVRVGFAIGHHNEMVGLNDQVLSAWNAIVVMESADVESQRPVLEEAVQELSEVPPWMGDETLSAAMAANGEALLGLVDQLMQSAALDMRVFLFGKKRRQRDSLLKEVNQRVPALNAKVLAAQEVFVESWQIDAYEQHIDALAKWAAARGEEL
ncbi:MAG: hypothetical protein ACI9VR_002950 [Cognaticolwellia sp.]|jgi:hypothetical protein